MTVAGMIGHFLDNHSDCIVDAYGGWDIITTVPSSGARSGVHPLISAVDLLTGYRGAYEPTLRRGPGELDHNRASIDGFLTTTDVEGKRVLIIEDTYTSGARPQSAAAAIEAAGGHATAILVVGRYIKPNYDDATRAWWAAQRSERFSFDDCCLQ